MVDYITVVRAQKLLGLRNECLYNYLFDISALYCKTTLHVWTLFFAKGSGLSREGLQ